MKKILWLFPVLYLACAGPQSPAPTPAPSPQPPLTTATNPQPTPPPVVVPPSTTTTAPPPSPPPVPPTTTGTVPPTPEPECSEPVVTHTPEVGGAGVEPWCTQCGKEVPCPQSGPTVSDPVPMITSGNCITAKCGNLGTATFTTDVKALFVDSNGMVHPPNKTPYKYIPFVLFFFQTKDGKAGVVQDERLLPYYPAGYTFTSMYYHTTTPTKCDNTIETCMYASYDAAGKCVHRWAGIVEKDAIIVWTGRLKWTFAKAYGEYGKSVVDTAVNAWLGKYGKYMSPPCLKLPCP